MKYIAFISLLLMFAAGGCGGGKSVSPDYGEPTLSTGDVLDAAQLGGKRPATLAELVRLAASSQYSSLDSIYNRPPEGMTDSYYVQLSESNEVVNLAERVTTYVQEGNVLAGGFRSGLIKIYGGGGCGALQAASEPVNEISWFPRSDILAASSGNNRVVEVFKVRECSRIRVADVNSTVDKFAISPKGTWLAVADEARRLFVGPADGQLRQIHRFLHQPLSLSFSDEEGILMAVDVTGQLYMWSPLKLSRIYEFKIKGGPFKSVTPDGPYLDIVTEKDEKFRWDLSQRAKLAYRESANGFFLNNGVLSYHSPRKRLVRRVFFSPAELVVERSGAAQLYRVKDIDGEFRYYSLRTGKQTDLEGSFKDWKPVNVDRDYAFSERGHDFILAEPIAQREFQRLYCRYIPGKGYFLWWKEVIRPDDYFKSRGMLPHREGISVNAPLKWVPMEKGQLDIRD